jgi:hypothetical protein
MFGKEIPMKIFRSGTAMRFVGCVLASVIVLPLGQGSASPLNSAAGGAILQMQNTVQDPLLVEVQWRRRSGAAAGAFVAGAIIGGLIASQVGPYPYYGPYPVYPYYAPYPYRVYPAPIYDGAIAYCIRRFRSYDPYSMTYLGYDGRRHPCP